MAIKVTVRKPSYNNIIPVRYFVRMPNMKEENERLFQENKDLRVHIGHLRDELANAKASVEIQRGFREERAEEIEALEKALAKSESESSQGMNAMVKFWEEAVNEKNKAEERAEEYRIALMESDCRVAELEKQLEWARNKNDEWAQFAAAQKNTIAAQKEEKEALEDVIRAFEETRKEYEEEIHAQHVEKREWMQKYEELKAQKEADDKKCEETCAACNEQYEDVLADRNHLREEVARLTNERDTAVNENTKLMFDINELQDKWEAEHNLHVEAEKERDMYRSSAEAWRAEHDKVVADVALYREKAKKYLEERDLAWDANKRMEGNEETITYYQEIADCRKEKLDEAMRTITSLNNDIHKLEETIDGLNEDKRAYGEEIDRLRKVVTNLQSTRFTTDEFIRMITRKLMPSTGNGFANSLDF